jgi:hypothetical protein
MAPTSDAMPHKSPRSYLLLAVLIAASVAAALGTAWNFDHGNAGKSLFSLSNLVGPTTESLLHGSGLTACTEDMGTPHNPICFHAGRMPLPSLVVTLGVRLLGNHYLQVAFFKTLLLLLPIEFAIYLVWLRMPRSPRRRAAITLLLLAPFAMTPFLANVVNLQVEEGYSYSFLAMAVALLFFGVRRTDSQVAASGIGQAFLLALALDGLYLAKSAMAPAAIVLLLAYLITNRRTGPRVLLLLLVVAAPIGWALHQHHASGRYSIGTSLDGINLHKSNHPQFLKRYPPLPGDTLDRFDAELNRGLYFDDEWSFNDYHQKAALDFLLHHPRATLQGDLRKLNVLLFSVKKIGSAQDHGAALLFGTAGLILFRLILWAAILSALYAVLRPRLPSNPSLRTAGAIFLALVAACALPYLVGFAYTRHASILIYPAVLMCCRMLVEEEPSTVAT